MTRRAAWTAAGVVAVLAVVAFFAGSLLTDDPEPTPAPTFAPPTQPPSRIVVVNAIGAMQIRASGGDWVRTVRADVGRSLANISATPDGRSVYLDAADGDCRVVQRVDVASGKVTSVAPGRSPVVSHDGSKLAFASPSDDCSTFNELEVRALQGGDERAHWSASDDPDGWGITYLRWSLDNRHLGLTLLKPAGYANKLVDTSDVVGPGTLDDEPDVVLAQGSEPVGFLSDGSLLVEATTRDGRFIQLQADDDDGPPRVLATREDVGIDLAHVVTDAEGEHLLWLERPRSDRDAKGAAELWRFTLGSRRPVRVAVGIVAADWLA